MPNFKLYGLDSTDIETMKIKRDALRVILTVVQQLRLQDTAVITLSKDEVCQAVSNLPPAPPYLELRSSDPLEMAEVIKTLQAHGFKMDTEFNPIGFLEAKEMAPATAD